MRDEPNGKDPQGPMTYNTDVPGRVDPGQLIADRAKEAPPSGKDVPPAADEAPHAPDAPAEDEAETNEE